MYRRTHAVLVVTGTSVLLSMLVRTAVPPAVQLRVLRQLPAPGADPLVGVLAGLAVVAELLAGYVLTMVVLGLLAGLPGLPGRLAAAGARAVTVPALRRALDGLLGGAFLAQAVLTPLGVAGQLVGRLPPVATSTGSSRPPAPLPTWLGGPRWQPGLPSAGSAPPPASAAPPAAGAGDAPGRGGPATRPFVSRGREAGRPEEPGRRVHVIEVGDTLWGIAASHLPAGDRPDAAVDAYWRQLYAANRAVLGDDPDLIHPGTRLTLPPFRPGRR
jgi:nucleoid-associated protein YgaU